MDIHDWFEHQEKILHKLSDDIKNIDNDDSEGKTSFELFEEAMERILEQHNYTHYTDIIIKALLTKSYGERSERPSELLEQVFNSAFGCEGLELESLIYRDNAKRIKAEFNLHENEDD